jgi:hypothetical protein
MALAASPIRHPRLAAASLTAAVALTAVSVAVQPDLSGDPRQTLAALASGPLPTVSAVSFLLSQLPFMVAYLAIGGLVGPRHPRLALWGTCLAVLGAFGHTVFGGMSLVYLVMAQDPANGATYAALISDIQSSPVMLFSVAGLVGTVIGTLVLSTALFHARVGARWIGPALWAFVLLEFVGEGFSRYAGYLAVLSLSSAFIALAAHIVRTAGPARWSPASPMAEPATEAV